MNNYLCPICNEPLYKLSSKLVCGNDKCDFQCLESNYYKELQPWNIQQCKDATLWKENVFLQYPYIIAIEYKRLFSLLEQNKLYGVIFQLKDIFEVLIKFPTLLVLNKYCNNRKRSQHENETLQFLLSKMLSLGDWHELAKRCLVSCSSENLKRVLENITRAFEKNKIINWRNDTLGHGALMFDDTKEFREELIKMLRIIKKHFDDCNEEYMQISLKYETNGKSTELRGNDISREIFKSEGDLIFDENQNNNKINELMKVQNSSLFFFDSFCQWDRKTKMLCYLDAQIIKLKLKYFEEMFLNATKYMAVSSDRDSSKLYDEIYTETEENIIKSISKVEQIVFPEFLYKWMNDNLSNYDKGTYLLQMERGMGKTTFSKIIDPHSYDKRKFDKTAVRVYYVNSTYSYKIESFENDIVDILKMNGDKTDKFKGSIPQFNNQLEISAKKQFVSVLDNFQKIYQKKFGTEKLLIIIDGIDEIPDLSKKTILDYIPDSNELPNNIYILVTSRIRDENPNYVNIVLDDIKFSEKMQILKNNEDYNQVLKEFISKKIRITNSELLESIIKQSNKRFLFIKPIEYIMKYSKISDLSVNNIFDEFLSLLEKSYIEKYYYHIIDILIILAISREGLTIEEISYLLVEESPDFKILAYLSDISCLLDSSRSYRGTIITLSHEELREFILGVYDERIQRFIDKWIDNVLDMNYKEVTVTQKYIIFNILFLTERFRPEKVEQLINNDKMKLVTIYNEFSKDKLTQYESHLLLQFMDDYIMVLETNTEKNAINLVNAYILRMQAFMKYAFGGDSVYYNYIDRALEIIYLYNIDEVKLKLQAYKLRCEYYRKVGNIKKSLDDNKVIEGYLEMYGESMYRDIEISVIDKIFMLHNKSINYKNLGEIDKAFKLAFDAKSMLEKNNTLEGKCLYSNVLNNLGLCYLKKEDYDQAEKYIRRSIEVIELIKKENGYIVDDCFNNYANLGQVLRKKEELDEAILIYTESLDKILMQERKGYLVDGNQKALHYNGRANVFRDLALKKKDKQFYEKAVSDYKEAIEIVEKIERKNQDLRFLGQLYINISTIYEYNLEQKLNAEPYKSKLNQINRESLRNQLDLLNEDDLSLDDRVYYLQAIQCMNKANEFTEKMKHKDAISLYNSAIDLINRIKSFNEHMQYLTEILAESYYNKACCSHKLLSEKIYSDYQLRMAGEKVFDDYSEFNPEEIVHDYLMCESSIVMSDNEKCQIYEHVSYVYCEVIKDYNKAKEYALKALNLKNDSEPAYCCLGNACCELEEYESAIKYYKKALEIMPEDLAAQNNFQYASSKLMEKNFNFE